MFRLSLREHESFQSSKCDSHNLKGVQNRIRQLNNGPNCPWTCVVIFLGAGEGSWKALGVPFCGSTPSHNEAPNAGGPRARQKQVGNTNYRVCITSKIHTEHHTKTSDTTIQSNLIRKQNYNGEVYMTPGPQVGMPLVDGKQTILNAGNDKTICEQLHKRPMNQSIPSSLRLKGSNKVFSTWRRI